MRRRALIVLILVCGTLGGGLAGAAGASANATFVCGPGTPAHTYAVTPVTTLTINTSNGDGNCSMTGSIPVGATVDLVGVGVTAANNSSNAGTLAFIDPPVATGGLSDSLVTATGGTFVNSGTILNSATSASPTLYAGTFLNFGTIESKGAGGSLIFSGSAPGVLDNLIGGKLNSDPGAKFEVDGPTSLKLEAGGTATVASGGTLAVNNSSLDVEGGAITGILSDSASAITFGSASSSTTGVLAVSGSESLAGAIPAGWTLTLNGAGLTVPAGTVNAGTIRFQAADDTVTAAGGGSFANRGTIVDAATSSNQVLSAGAFTNSGIIRSAGSGGKLIFSGPAPGVLDNLAGGQLMSDAGADLEVDGPMSLKLEAGGTAVVAGGGTMAARNGAVDLLGGTVSGELTASASAISFDPAAAFSTGTVAVTGSGSLAGTIPAGWTLTLDGTALSVASGAANAGTIRFLDLNDTLSTPPGGSFTNGGTIIDQASGYRQALFAGRFVNSGRVEAAGAGGNLVFGGEAVGGGTGLLENASGGGLKSDLGSNLEIDAPMSLKLDGGSSTTAIGTLHVRSTQLDLAGGTVNGSLSGSAPAMVFEAAAASSSGQMNATGDGSLSGTIPAGWTVSEAGGGISAAAGAGNAGSFVFVDGNPSLNATGAFTNSGTILDLFGGGAGLTAGPLTNTGTISVPGGGRLNIDGGLNLSPSSTLSVGVAGAGAGAFGAVRVSGTLSLGGTLAVMRRGTYSPRNGDTQQIMTAGSRRGSFARALGGNGHGFYVLLYSPTAVILETTRVIVTLRPSLSSLTFSPRSFKPATKGATITPGAKRQASRRPPTRRQTPSGSTLSYRDSQAATTTFSILRSEHGRRVGSSCQAPSRHNRHGRSCTRLVSVGSLLHHDRAGVVRLHFSGRIHGRSLSRGSYELRAQATLNGLSSRIAQGAFSIR